MARREDMVLFETIKALPALVKDWRRNSDVVFQWLACLAAIGVLVSLWRDQRPSDALVVGLRGASAVAASNFVAAHLPGVLAQPHPAARHLALVVAVLLVATLVIGPVVSARRLGWPVEQQAQGLIGARCPASVWIVLLLAAQFGPLDVTAPAVRSYALAALLLVCAHVGVVAWLVHRARPGSVTRALAGSGSPLGPAVEAVTVVLLMAAVSLAVAAAGPVIGLVSWLAATESDTHHAIRCEVTRAEARRRRDAETAPAGAEDHLLPGQVPGHVAA